MFIALVGIAVLVIGTIALFKEPNLPGGTFSVWNVRVSAQSAGVLLILAGIVTTAFGIVYTPTGANATTTAHVVFVDRLGPDQAKESVSMSVDDHYLGELLTDGQHSSAELPADLTPGEHQYRFVANATFSNGTTRSGVGTGHLTAAPGRRFEVNYDRSNDRWFLQEQ
jgi:hypothetical protein